MSKRDLLGPTPEQQLPRPLADGQVRWTLVWRYSARLALIAVTVAAAAWMLIVFGHWRGGPVARDNSIDDAAGSSPVAMQMSDFLSGNWLFEASPWAVGVTRVEQPQIEAKMAALPSGGPSIRSGTMQPNSISDDRRLLAWIRQMDLHPTRQGDFMVYRKLGPQARLVAYTSHRGDQEHLELVRVATSDSRGGWLMLETQSVRAGLSDSQTDIQLPLPASTTRTGIRRDGRGNPVCDLFQVEARIDSIPAYWRQQGWSVSESTTATDPVRQCRCEHAGNSWLVWLHCKDDGTGTILAIRETVN